MYVYKMFVSVSYLNTCDIVICLPLSILTFFL